MAVPVLDNGSLDSSDCLTIRREVKRPMNEVKDPTMRGVMRVNPKKPWLAAVLGILFLGLGLFYVGKWGYGILLLIVGIIVSVFTAGLAAPIFWIISAVWAYYAAKSYNERAGY
jgi:hypothetical protein